MTSRLLAALALLLLWVGTASAQILPGGTAPSTHPGTRLNFPPSLGGAELEHSYTTPVGRDVHYVYQYVINKVQITVFLFDNDRRVTAGSESPMVTTQFTAELDAAEKAMKADGFTNFERPAVPSDCRYGSIAFRCIVYSALAQRDRLFSKLLLTGYNGYFLKIRVDWSQGSGQTTADADRALQAFVPALVK
ncbi:MAG TPA: hypothetical protein VFB13_02540 [Reyranella sp.]|nr:hypothetical protein [Reyranella sp.]